MSAILRNFLTTAEREAFRFTANHVGRLVTDAESGITYLVIGEGLGATRNFPLDASAGFPGYGTPGDIQPDDSASAGVATTVARSDHRHSIVAAPAGAATPGDSAAEGSATAFARSDHKHSLAAFGTGAGTFCQGSDSRLSDARTPTSHHTSHESGGGDAIKLDDLAAPDDNTDLNASTTAHGLMKKLSGNVSDVFRGDGTFGVAGGVGGVYITSVPPTSLGTYDDYFTGNLLTGAGGKWSEWDPAGIISPAIDSTYQMVRWSHPGNGGTRWAGIFQAVPASEFVIYAWVRALDTSPANAQAGIFVADDLVGAPTTADIRTATFYSGGAAAETWAAYNGAVSASSTVTTIRPQGGWVRLRCNGTTVASDCSDDGWVWRQIASVTIGFTPLYMGLGSLCTTNLTTNFFSAKLFKVFTGAGCSAIEATEIGRVL